MPKTSQTDRQKAEEWVAKFSQEFSILASSLHCKLCDKRVSCAKTYQVENHRATKLHKSFASINSVASEEDHEFKLSDEVTKCFLACDIPLFKLNNRMMKELFAKMNQKLPSESSCRQKVKSIAESERQRISEKLKNSKIFLIIDESDIRRKKVFIEF